MNARDKELAEQADLIQWDTLPSGARTPDHESVVKAKKFAALTRADERKSIVTMLKDEVNVETAADCIWAIEARENT